MADARDFIDQRLRRHGLSRHSDVVRLVASELITNAVVHAGTPFTVTLARRNGSLVLTVKDGSLAALVVAAATTPAGPNGRGLNIVESLVSSWGVTPHSNGKTIWAHFDVVARSGR